MIERLSSKLIFNIPELFPSGHNNPLHLSPVAQLTIIVVLVAAMEVFNFMIRYREKSKFYPILYTLLTVSLLAIFYYCFQNPQPEVYTYYQSIGWFCNPKIVGKGWFIVSIVALIAIIYFLQCAIMQATAEISVHAGLSEGKLWKEWKWAMIIAMLGVAIAFGCKLASAKGTAWVILLTVIVLFLFCFGKIIADSLRGTSVWRCILVGIIFFVGLVAVIMLTLECVRATILAFIICLALFSTAKARKKKYVKKA